MDFWMDHKLSFDLVSHCIFFDKWISISISIWQIYFFWPFFLRRPLISSRANKSKANTVEVFASVFAFIYISNYLVRCIRSSCWLVHCCCNMSNTQARSDRKSILSWFYCCVFLCWNFLIHVRKWQIFKSKKIP